MKQDNHNKYSLTTVTKALEIFDLFNGSRDGLSLTEIALAMALPKSSMVRYLATLEQYDYLERDKETERYHLGVKFLRLGAVVARRQNLRPVATPVMWQLRERFRETVNLAVPRDGMMVYLEVVESPNVVKMTAQVGSAESMYVTSLGRSIMAVMPRIELNTDQPLERFTKNTITDWPTLLRELEQIQRQGYAVDDRETDDQVRCVGAAIRDHRAQPVAAISISGPENRLTMEHAHEIGPELLKACNHISALIGFK